MPNRPMCRQCAMHLIKINHVQVIDHHRFRQSELPVNSGADPIRFAAVGDDPSGHEAAEEGRAQDDRQMLTWRHLDSPGAGRGRRLQKLGLCPDRRLNGDWGKLLSFP
jgi:hypothetical protein